MEDRRWFRCSDLNHRVVECTAEAPRCAACAECGLPAAHRIGDRRCARPRSHIGRTFRCLLRRYPLPLTRLQTDLQRSAGTTIVSFRWRRSRSSARRNAVRRLLTQTPAPRGALESGALTTLYLGIWCDRVPNIRFLSTLSRTLTPTIRLSGFFFRASSEWGSWWYRTAEVKGRQVEQYTCSSVV